MRHLVSSIEGEYLRYKSLAERAIEQVPDEQLAAAGGVEDNSITVIVWHVAGNLQSRFTDFLTSDGEKPWRNRDDEFVGRIVTREDLLARWTAGWRPLLAALEQLTDADLERTVVIRGESFPIYEALHRSLSHTAYHVGQIVFVAKSLRGADWGTLSIPRGASGAFNQNPVGQRPRDHAARLQDGPGR